MCVQMVKWGVGKLKSGLRLVKLGKALSETILNVDTDPGDVNNTELF